MVPLFKASLISGLIGRNKYINVEKEINKLRYKYLLKFGIIKEDPDPIYDKIYNLYKKQINIKNLEDINICIKNHYENIDNMKIEDNIKNIHKDVVRNLANMTYGINNEKEKLLMINKKLNINIIENNIKTYTYNGDNFIIIGKCDGFIVNDDNNRILIEIKNRVNKLYNYILPYEFIQVQILMYISNVKKCILIEVYNNDIHHYDIDIDYNIIQNIFKYLSIVSSLMCIKDDTLYNESLLKYNNMITENPI